MTRNRTPGEKLRLTRERRRARPIPTWVVARTKLRVRVPRRRRSWRRSKIGL